MKKKMLFVSSSAEDKLNVMYEAFRDIDLLDIEVIFNGEVYQDYYSKSKSFFEKFLEKIKLPIDINSQNKKIISFCKKNKVDFLFIVKGNHIWPKTLRAIKNQNIKIISWTQDDMYLTHNRSWYYTFGLKYYDLIVTQKSYNLKSNELPSLGAKNILFQNKSYLPRIHKPYFNCKISKYNYDVLFIGSAENERFNSMCFLANNGISVNVFGSGWDKASYINNKPKNLNLNFKNILNQDYAEAISCSRITLCFLRKINRDLQTSRTVEIPACGGFMLAERTDEQLELFEEGLEAEYFSTDIELLEKVKFYLKNDKKRFEIAKNGRQKCISSGYDYQNRAREIINYFKT